MELIAEEGNRGFINGEEHDGERSRRRKTRKEIQEKKKEKPEKKMKPRNEIDHYSKELQKKKVKKEEEKISPRNEVFRSFQKKKNQGDTEKRNKFRASPFSCTVT